MQILLALIIGAALGYGIHLLLPERQTRGAALAPLTGALTGGIVWLVLTWLGLGVDNPVIWLAAVAAPAIVVTPALLVLTRVRRVHDARTRERLRIG